MHFHLQQTIGYIAGVGTSVSFFPQLLHVIRNQSVKDLSPFMFMIHSTGAGLWVVYGNMVNDTIIILFNSITLFFNVIILIFFILGYYRKKQSIGTPSKNYRNEPIEGLDLIM